MESICPNCGKNGMSQLLTIKDLAQLMGWSPQAVYDRRFRGDSLPRSVEVGRTIRYRLEDVERWLEEHAEPAREEQ